MVTGEIAALFTELDAAFGDLPIPGEDRIVYDNSGYHLECNQVRAKFRNRHWRDLTVEDLQGEADSLAFFTLEAFRFFLPAFIRVAVLDPVRADLIPDSILGSLVRPDLSGSWEERKEPLLETIRRLGMPEKLLLDLAPKADPELDAFCRAHVEALSDHQRQAVMSFVVFLKKHRSQDFIFGELELAERALRF